MAKPHMDIRNGGPAFHCICRSGCPQRMERQSVHGDSDLGTVAFEQLIDPIACNRQIQPPSSVVANGTKECTGPVFAVICDSQTFLDGLMNSGVGRNCSFTYSKRAAALPTVAIVRFHPSVRSVQPIVANPLAAHRA